MPRRCSSLQMPRRAARRRRPTWCRSRAHPARRMRRITSASSAWKTSPRTRCCNAATAASARGARATSPRSRGRRPGLRCARCASSWLMACCVFIRDAAVGWLGHVKLGPRVCRTATAGVWTD
eukprot:5732877-Prymnesium_polylepis.1